jgi:hypothetical protein
MERYVHDFGTARRREQVGELAAALGGRIAREYWLARCPSTR